MSLLIVSVLFYLIGSFPTAYLLVRFKYNKNLSEEGSGNIGARNTYDVTNSKKDGIIVLIIDFLKGLIPALWFAVYSGFGSEQILFPAVCLIIGHNFSVWLGFKGGRGLATAAGIFAVLNFSLIILWLIICAAVYFKSKNIHIANIAGLLLMPVIFIVFYGFLSNFNSGYIDSNGNGKDVMILTTISVCIIILIKHVKPIRDYFKELKIEKL